MSAVREPLGIVGAGTFGGALAEVVRAGGGTVWLAEGAHQNATLAEVTARARLIILAVSSRRVREVLPLLAAHVDGRHALVHAIGALVMRDGTPAADEPPSLRVSELIRAETAVRKIGVIAGPALAKDLTERKPAALVVASPFDEVIAATQRALSAPPALRVYSSHDLVGAELASAIIGAFTVGLGLADALDMGEGPRALLITRAVAEAARLVAAAGGRERTVTGLAGLGNLIVRSSPGASARSDDYQLGLAVGKGGAPARASEGSRTLPALLGLAAQVKVRVPILAALHAAVHDKVPVASVVGKLLETHAEEE